MSNDKIKADNRASQVKSDDKKIESQASMVKPPEQAKPWTPPSSLDAPPAPTGFQHRWLRAESLGFNDSKNIQGRLRSGYELVRSDEYPNSDYPVVEDGKYKGVIGVGGLLLARISTELVQSRKEYFDNLTKQKDEAIENDLLKEQHPGMPIDHDRQTRVTFGGTKKS